MQTTSATPTLLLFIMLCMLSCNTSNRDGYRVPKNFDLQGHRGARGLMAENSIAGMMTALEWGVQTLEMDVVVSADSQLILSHEPWFSSVICKYPNGKDVPKAREGEEAIFKLSYQQIKAWDCGSRGNERFPEQHKFVCFKPSLKELVYRVEDSCRMKSLPLPNYNIEIKSRPEWDNVLTPAPETFARLMYAELVRWGIKSRAIVQSFDLRPLQVLHRLDPSVALALLVSENEDAKEKLKALGFVPHVLSPHHSLVNKELVDFAHTLQMKVIPWTVNDTPEMERLVAVGVDGLITDYPDRFRLHFSHQKQ